MSVMRLAVLAVLFFLQGPLHATAAPLIEPAVLATGAELSTLAEPVVEVPQSPRRGHWYGRASVGMAYRWAFDQSMLAAGLDGELGAQNQRLAGGVRLHIEAGRLLTGLPFQVVTFGPMMWARFYERFRVGIGLEGGALLINRKTMPGRSMWTVMLGGRVGGSVDILRLGPTGALQIDTSIGAYALTLAPGPVSILTTLALAYRP